MDTEKIRLFVESGNLVHTKVLIISKQAVECCGESYRRDFCIQAEKRKRSIEVKWNVGQLLARAILNIVLHSPGLKSFA
jgi:hypothetical protein